MPIAKTRFARSMRMPHSMDGDSKLGEPDGVATEGATVGLDPSAERGAADKAI